MKAKNQLQHDYFVRKNASII